MIADDSMVLEQLAPYHAKAEKFQMIIVNNDTNKSNAKVGRMQQRRTTLSNTFDLEIG